MRHAIPRLLVVVVVAFAAPALASSVAVLSLADMKQRATVVVEATVVDVRVEHEGAREVTYTTLRVDDAIEGSARGELLIVFQPGVHPSLARSIANGRVRWIAGHRPYVVGERVVFFGVRHVMPSGLHVVVHLTLGYGTFDVDDAGAVSERVLDVLDARTHRPPAARTFSSRAAFRRAMQAMQAMQVQGRNR